MRIIFCNITYLKYYDGRVIGEVKPQTGGRWVQENEDAHEKWNFLNMDGKCYGYVQGNSEQMHIEKLDKVYGQQDEAEDILVVWCASHPTRGTVVVGWYEHATVYRYLQNSIITPLTGIDRSFWFSTKAENAYLMPEEYRTLEIGRASKQGAGKGFGQQNYWYAESEYAKEVIIPAVLDFIETHRSERINVLTEEFEPPHEMKPLSDEEISRAEELGEDEDLTYLPYAYRMYVQEPNADNAYKIATTLKNLFQYSKSIQWYEKTLELDPEDWETKGVLAYVYSQCEKYEQTICLAKELLDSPIAADQEIKDELLCMIADGYYFEGEINEALMWQDRIIKESRNQDLISHTKRVKADWEKMIAH